MEMESFAGSAEMTLFWHCIFPGDISSKPRRREIYACGDCGEDCDGFRGVVLWLGDPEHPHTSLCSICHSSLTTSPFLRVSPRSLSLPESRTVRRARMHQREPPWRGCTTLKSIHVKQTKEQSESKITMKSCDILFFVSLYMQIYFFLIRFDFVTSNIGKMNRSICRAEKRISFRKSRHAFIFTRKTTQISQPPPIRELSIRAQSLALVCCTEIFAKKKHSTKKKEKNSEMINLWGIAAASADMSEQEWRSLKLSRHPSVARWHPRSPAPLDVFFPAADERRWQEAWNALDLFIARRTAICLGTDAPLNSEMVG